MERRSCDDPGPDKIRAPARATNVAGMLQNQTAGRAFVKMHGLRNHFVIIDARDEPCRAAADEIVRICDVQVGVGADQLVVLEPGSGNGTHAFMRLYNVDGREVEACGNATRCVAWLLLEESGRDEVVIETLAGRLRCQRAGNLRVSCDMGRVSLDWRKVPLARAADTLHVGAGSGPLTDGVALSIGNPHVVYFVDDLASVDIPRHAAPIQKDPMFRNGVNVGVAQVVDASNLKLAVYERGVGLTMACGSGACVAAYAARARGLTTSTTIRVELPGGSVDIEIRPDDTAVMTGPVAWCFSGRLPSAET